MATTVLLLLSAASLTPLIIEGYYTQESNFCDKIDSLSLCCGKTNALLIYFTFLLRMTSSVALSHHYTIIIIIIILNCYSHYTM